MAGYDVKEQLSRWVRAAILVTALHDVATFVTRCTGGLLLLNGCVGRVFGDNDLRRAASDTASFEQDLYRALRSPVTDRRQELTLACLRQVDVRTA